MKFVDRRKVWKQRFWFFYRLAAYLRLKLSPETIYTTSSGACFYISRYSYVERLIQKGEFEKTRAAFLREILARGDVFLDIGANIGFFTVLAAQCGASVKAFEPDPLNYRRLLRNIKLNGLNSAQVETRPWGVGRESGKALLHRPLTDNYGMSSIVSNQSPDGMGVPVRRLDDLVSSFDSRYVIKVDVEGAELQVLQGAMGVLPQMKVGSLWLVEVHRGAGVDANSVVDHFKRHDYRIDYFDEETGKKVPAVQGIGDILLLAEKLPALHSD